MMEVFVHQSSEERNTVIDNFAVLKVVHRIVVCEKRRVSSRTIGIIHQEALKNISRVIWVVEVIKLVLRQ